MSATPSYAPTTSHLPRPSLHSALTSHLLPTTSCYQQPLATQQPLAGETAFPRAKGDAVPDTETLNCKLGKAVKPERGKALLFYSLLPSGDLDYASQHIGCDVHEGEKWSANFWIWSQESPMNRGGGDARHFQDGLSRQLAQNASC